MTKIGIKKAGLFFCTVISLFALVGSSIWEGAAGVAAGGDLPGSGLYIATNSFPLNTVVYVTNLANGQTTRVVTSSALETAPGLLAMLSRDAADAIGLQGRTLGRIRMSQPAESVAFSRFGQRRGGGGEGGRGGRGEGRGRNLDPGASAFDFFDLPAGRAGDEIINLPGAAAEPAAIADPVEPSVDAFTFLHGFLGEEVYQTEEPLVMEELIAEADLAEADILADIMEEVPVEAEGDFLEDAIALMHDHFPEYHFEVVEDFFAPDTVAEEQENLDAPFAAEDYLLALVPAEARPPVEEAFAPDPDYIIAGIAPVLHDPLLEAGIDTAMLIDPAGDAGVFPHAFAPPLTFPVSMISRLQAGKYYLQIAAYSNVEAVQYELLRLDRIDSSLTREVVVMRGENPEHGTVYQVLIGPLNLGESGALLQRFRSTTHRDAFIRAGS